MLKACTEIIHPKESPISPENTKHSESEKEGAERLVVAQSALASLVLSVQDHNAPADRIPANWMARGHVQELEFLEKTMVLQVRPVKIIPEGMYHYWTTNPLLQIQLFAAYLCHFVVDIFSIAPEGPSTGLFKNGGEILTISVDLAAGQTLPSHQDSTKTIP